MLAVRRNYLAQDPLSLGSQHCWQVNARIYSGYPTYNKVKMLEMVVEEVTTLPLHGFRSLLIKEGYPRWYGQLQDFPRSHGSQITSA